MNERFERRRQWHRWFAWYPVRVEGKMKRFCTVERRWKLVDKQFQSFIDNVAEGYWEYRNVE